jgi:hypothetical protein
MAVPDHQRRPASVIPIDSASTATAAQPTIVRSAAPSMLDVDQLAVVLARLLDQ